MPISEELKFWFTELTSHSPFFFALVDATFHYTFVNHRYEEISGLSQEELIGSSDRKIFGNQYFNQIKPLYDQAFNGERVESEINFKLNGIENSIACIVFSITDKNENKYVLFQGIDVSEKIILSQSLSETENKFNTLLHSVSDGVILADQNTILSINPAATKLLGYKSAEELLGETLNELFIDSISKDPYRTDITNLLRQQSTLECLTSDICGSTKAIQLHYSSSSLLGRSVDFILLKEIVPTLTEQSASSKSVTYQNHSSSASIASGDELTIDPLTNLYNRNGLIKRLDLLIKDKTPLILYYIDIDNFKNINDSLGHTIGDKVIKEISNRLKRTVPSDAILAHLGADEFAVILPEPPAPEIEAQLAEKIIALINEPFNLNYFSKRLACSIGTVSFPENGTDGRNLLQNADTAMYEAKSRGRNRMIAFEERMNKEARTRLWLEIELQKALQQNGLEVWYQPKVSAQDYTINGAEALIRWKHPIEGYISPGAFIPVAEKAGLIEQVGRVVMREVFSTVKRWNQQNILPGKVAINLSPEQFGNPKLIRYMSQLLEATRLKPSCITFELTETAVMSDGEHTIQMLNSIKKLGFTLSIDDFGTGYSSLSYLARFPIDELKIDRAFITDVDTLPKQVTVIENIINLGKSLNLSVVAEGVETQNQAQLLSSLNCNSIQGFHFYRPQPRNEVEILFAKQMRRRSK